MGARSLDVGLKRSPLVIDTLLSLRWSVRLYSLSVIGPERYFTMVDLPYKRPLFVFSLDFDQSSLEKILPGADGGSLPAGRTFFQIKA